MDFQTIRKEQSLFQVETKFFQVGGIGFGYFKEVLRLPLPEGYERMFEEEYCLCTNHHTSATSDEGLMNDQTAVLSRKTKPENLLSLYDFPQKAEDLMTFLLPMDCSGTRQLITRSHKAEPKRGPRCKTWSKYIGVTRNGNKWQSLISVNKRKTYIGSYDTERECAVAFDFHCILVHGLKARTNFSYTKGDLVSMLQSYKQNSDSLVPETLNSH